MVAPSRGRVQGEVDHLLDALRYATMGHVRSRSPRARHRRWLEAVRSRRPLSQDGVWAAEMLTARRAAKQERAMLRFLERLMFGGPDPTVLLAPDPPRFPK